MLNRNRELDIDNLISGLSSDAIVDLRQGFSSFNSVYMGTFDGVNVIDISGLYDNEIKSGQDFYITIEYKQQYLEQIDNDKIFDVIDYSTVINDVKNHCYC